MADSKTSVSHPVAPSDSGTPPVEASDIARRVEITINGKRYPIDRGRHRVAELKVLGGVPECDELAEVKHGELHPLPDDGATHIEGGEAFLSSPRSCPNS